VRHKESKLHERGGPKGPPLFLPLQLTLRAVRDGTFGIVSMRTPAF
jgi:hypothetical protein